jgi:hypothetical protein
MNRAIQPEAKVKNQSYVSVERNFLMLSLGWLHAEHAVQRGIWVPTQHFLCDERKPRKTLIELAGRKPSGCKLTSNQQTGFKSASTNIIPYLCWCVFFPLVSFVSFLPNK